MSTATTLQIDLTGKRALVTGGTRGIGKGITDRLRAAGATVVVAARSAPRTPSPQVITADIATADGSATIAERTLAILGGVDIVVHNVGGSQVSPGSVTNLTDGDWNQAFQINLFGAALAVLWATGSLVGQLSSSWPGSPEEFNPDRRLNHGSTAAERPLSDIR